MSNEASQDQIDYINLFKGDIILSPDRDKAGEKLIKQAIENGWLLSRDINDPYYNKTYSYTHFNKLDLNITVEPFSDLDIDLRGNKTYTKNTSQQLDVVNNVLNNDSPITQYGNFSISHNMLKTAFKNSDANFEEFKQKNYEIF